MFGGCASAARAGLADNPRNNAKSAGVMRAQREIKPINVIGSVSEVASKVSSRAPAEKKFPTDDASFVLTICLNCVN